MDIDEILPADGPDTDDDRPAASGIGLVSRQYRADMVDVVTDAPEPGALVRVDYVLRACAAAIEERLRDTRPPLEILERLCAQVVADAPEWARADACRLLAASLVLRGIEPEIAHRVALHADVEVCWP